MKNPELTIVLEGITINTAAELIFGTQKTAENRKYSRHTYLSCLEDVVQAMVFSDKIIVSGNLPDVGGEYPGREFLELFGKDKVRKIQDNKEFNPDELLANPQIFKLTKAYLKNLDNSYIQDILAWNEFINREYGAYFYPKGTQEIAFINGSYVFGKNYVINIELEQEVPQKFINRLLASLDKILVGVHKKPAPEQLKSFIQRVTLTHVLIWLNYKKQFKIRKIPEYNKNYFPSVTRSTLLTSNSKYNVTPVVAWKTLLPRLLAPYLKRYCTEREDILKIIPALAADLKSRRYRELFLNAVFEFQSGNLQNLETLKTELETLFKDEKHKRTWGILGTYNPLDGAIGIGIEKEFEFSHKSKMVKNLERTIIHIPERYEPYEIEAKRLFKELY